MPTIQELKNYIGIDGSHNDSLLADFLLAAQDLAENVLRVPIGTFNPMPAAIKEALKYAVGFLYTHRESAHMPTLERALKSFLAGHRKKEF